MLGTIGDRRSTSTVIDALRDEQINVRVSAAIALGKIGDPVALPALTAALTDTEETTINAPTTLAHHAREAIDAIHKRQRTVDGVPDGRK
ncbi:MAG: HEAT repeat domain-containing protein [Planctomycetota bacterium]|nr:HEAT repeat domain-containing protein [Planctomycetota bacterium]